MTTCRLFFRYHGDSVRPRSVTGRGRFCPDGLLSFATDVCLAKGVPKPRRRIFLPRRWWRAVCGAIPRTDHAPVLVWRAV